MPLKMLKALIPLEIGVSLPWAYSVMVGELTDKCHRITYDIFIFS